jgi:putative heme-binding domain-containing protein
MMRISLCVLLLCLASVCQADTPSKSMKPSRSRKKAAVNAAAARPNGLDAAATPAAKIKAAKGFQVELLYSVPKSQFGSWVNLAVDPKGRLITSDQYGSLYRITVPRRGDTGEPEVERIPVELGQAHGLLCAFGCLYVVVNGDGASYPNGLYRVRDKNNDDQYDSVELLRQFSPNGGEHGPHAVILAPDGKSLFVVCGNRTKPVETVRSRVPRVWDEDQLLPRLYGKGFMRGTPPPAGSIYHVDAEGKNWELVACGFRNPFDAAFNADGELFAYDADMEWDIGMPWYRPTRVCHVVSGTDWGWRNGGAKWPVYYPDTLPPAINVGPGSPTGVTFGYGAKFPPRYQNALFMCDWSFGKMYATHLKPSGATYGGELEDFITATPLPLTDVVINRVDGAMYFTIGGRGVQSGLYRVTYVGNESTAAAVEKGRVNDLQATRRRLESYHVGDHADAVDKAWPYLNHSDRYIRNAARTVLEHQPLELWQNRALRETDSQASLTALLALVRRIPRSFKPNDEDLDTPPPHFPVDKAAHHPLLPTVLAALERLTPARLPDTERLSFFRLYGLTLYRLGPPDEVTRKHVTDYLDALYPAQEREANVLLTEMMCYLQAPSAAEKGVKLLNAAPTQESQLDLARSLRYLRADWTPKTRRAFFEWIVRAQAYTGGENMRLVIEELKADALDGLTPDDRRGIEDLLTAPAATQVSPVSSQPRPFVKEWKMADVAPLLDAKLAHRDFEHGKRMFAAANCFSCHRFNGEGGAVGPDLTTLSGRFSARDILESVLEPSKVISDQYVAMDVLTTSGKTITGRVVNFSGNSIHLNTNMLDPTALEKIDRRDIDKMETSKVSMMPSGLLNTLNETELLDLFAFLLSRGDRHNAMFKP